MSIVHRVRWGWAPAWVPAIAMVLGLGVCRALMAADNGAAAGSFVLVQQSSLFGGDTRTVLVNRADASFLEKFASDEFVQYIYRASESGTLLDRAYGAVPAGYPGAAIVVGVAGLPPFEEISPRSLPLHGFRIRATAKRMDVIGQSEQGASNGLYWLLWEKVGVRWYMPSRLGEEVPVLKKIDLAPMDMTAGPAIPCSTFDVHYYGANANRTRVGRDHRDFSGRHIWSEIVPPTPENHRDHPEWFALTSRKELPKQDWMTFVWKDPSGAIRSDQVCTTNPEVLRMFVAKAKEFFRANPDGDMFPVEPNDYEEFCTCPRCQELDRKLGNGPLCNRLIYFLNQVAEEVKKDFPDRHLGFYAYSHHTEPPTTVKPDPMLVPALCFFGGRACYQHAIDDPACPTNRAWKEKIFDPWTKLCSRFGYYSYYAYSGRWQGPQLMLRTIPKDVKLMKERGAYHLHVDGYANWATCAPAYYLIRRLMWDVDGDPKAILDDWYRGVYGPAYEPMKKYWEGMTDGYYQGPHHGSGPENPELMFTREVIAKAWTHMKEAEAATAAVDVPDRYRQRVAIARAGLEYTDSMALAYALAGQKKWSAAIAAGKKAQQAIVDSRRMEMVPYITPLWPRDEHTWLWYRTWDLKNSSEQMTDEVVKQWESQAGTASAGRGG